MIAGIDKLWVNTPDFRVKEVNSSIFGIDTTIAQGGKEGELPHLLVDAQGREVRANKIYHNPKDGKGLAHYTIGRMKQGVGLMVQFNPSKIIHPYHLVEVGGKDYKKALSLVQTEMESIGIQANLSTMSINRLDIAKQAEMDYPCYQYDEAFRLMRMTRAKGRSYEGGFYFSNKSTQALFYDKRQEMQYNKSENILCGEANFMRAEIRALRNKSVASIMQVGTLAHLNEMGGSDIDTCYNKYINNRIFGRATECVQSIINFDGEVDIMKHYLSMGRGGWKTYLINEGLDEALLRVGGIDMFGRILSEAGMERSWVFRAKAKIQYMLSVKANADKLRDKITPATLIAELKQKFAA